MINSVDISEQDAVYDIGSGLGRICVLFELLTDAHEIRGVEVNRLLHSLSLQISKRAGLSRTEFIYGDAGEVDLSGSTIFFLFSPFTGPVFDTVLGRLSDVARGRRIAVCSYGRSSERIAMEPWLACVDTSRMDEYKLAIFQST